jgi:hypothetical protein
MRRSTFLVIAAAVLASAALSAPASAQVAGEAEGVTAVRGAHGIVLRFGPRAAKAYRRIAGRRVLVGCATVPKPSGFGISSSGGSSGVVRAPRRRGALRTGDLSRADYCTVKLRRSHDLVAWAAVTARGRTYLDEVATAGLLELPFLIGDESDAPPSVARVVERSKGVIVALDGPDGSPPAGRIGYWTDGSRAVTAALTRAGRRLFIDIDGDVVRSNALPYLDADL